MKRVRKGFSTKTDGSMYLDRVAPLPVNLLNRKRYFSTLGLGQFQQVAALGAHQTTVQRVDRATPTTLPDTDGLVTSETGIVLSLTGADCFPVFLEDSVGGIIGLAHCGWRGIVTGMVESAIDAMVRTGSVRENIQLTIGPGICTEHFEVQTDVLPQFADYPDFILRDHSLHVDLKGIVKHQAAENGILEVNIRDQNECTYCLAEKYFSFRRDKPSALEAQVAYIVQEEV